MTEAYRKLLREAATAWEAGAEQMKREQRWKRKRRYERYARIARRVADTEASSSTEAWRVAGAGFEPTTPEV